MSDTPRTDEVASLILTDQTRLSRQQVSADFARGLERELNKLQSAIAAHHSQKADDRCIEDDDRLYAAAGLPPCDRRVGSKEAMLANCARFVERRCESGGWKSYAELESEISNKNAALNCAMTVLKVYERHCLCGARPESINTHPHVSGCAMSDALDMIGRALKL